MATTLHELVQENQAENKDKIAVVYDDEDVVSMVTYKELWEQALEVYMTVCSTNSFLAKVTKIVMTTFILVLIK